MTFRSIYLPLNHARMPKRPFEGEREDGGVEGRLGLSTVNPIRASLLALPVRRLAASILCIGRGTSIAGIVATRARGTSKLPARGLVSSGSVTSSMSSESRIANDGEASLPPSFSMVLPVRSSPKDGDCKDRSQMLLMNSSWATSSRGVGFEGYVADVECDCE